MDREEKPTGGDGRDGGDRPDGQGAVFRFGRPDGGVTVVDPAHPEIQRTEYSDGAEIVTQKSGTITYLNIENGSQWSFDGQVYSYSSPDTEPLSFYLDNPGGLKVAARRPDDGSQGCYLSIDDANGNWWTTNDAEGFVAGGRMDDPPVFLGYS